MTDDPEDLDPTPELEAMKAIAKALSGLNGEARVRVMHWVGDKFNLSFAARGKVSGKPDQVSEEDEGSVSQFKTFADLYAAAAPALDTERALVAGYWHQFEDPKAEFGSQAINTALKNLGHGVVNITQALDGLKDQKPALVMQTRKAGTSQQARKTYKLTEAGKTAVELLMKKKK